MEVTYTLMPEDVASLYHEAIAARRRRQSGRATFSSVDVGYYLAAATIPLLCFFFIGLAVKSWELASVLGWLSLFVWRPILNQILTRRHIRRLQEQPGVLGTHTVRLDADGLFHRNGYCEWKIFWPGILDIVSMPHHLVFVAEGNHTPCVPKRAFADMDAIEVFLAAARACRGSESMSWPPSPTFPQH